MPLVDVMRESLAEKLDLIGLPGNSIRIRNLRNLVSHEYETVVI
ncbi:MAG: hypothetical protein WAO19_10850 [Candidatus Kryptoniota bacterium]